MFQGIFKSAIKMPDTNTNYIFGTGSIPIQIKTAQLVTFADGTTKQQGYSVAEVNKLISTMLTGWNANGNKPKSMSDNYLELILSCDNGFVIKKRLQFPHVIAWQNDDTPYNIADVYKEFSVDNWLKADDFENPDITLVVEPVDEILTTSTATPPEATTTDAGRFYLYYRNLPVGVNRVHIDFHIKTKTEPIDFDLEVIDGLSWEDAETILASNDQAKINVLLSGVKDVYKFTGAEGNFDEITMHEWSALYQQTKYFAPNNEITHDLYFYVYDESELSTKITDLEDQLTIKGEGFDWKVGYIANNGQLSVFEDKPNSYICLEPKIYTEEKVYTIPDGMILVVKKGSSPTSLSVVAEGSAPNFTMHIKGDGQYTSYSLHYSDFSDISPSEGINAALKEKRLDNIDNRLGSLDERITNLEQEGNDVITIEENLFDKNSALTKVHININGELYSNNYSCVSNYILVEKGKKYTFVTDRTHIGAGGLRVILYNNDKSYRGYILGSYVDETSQVVFTAPQDCYVRCNMSQLSIENVMFVRGEIYPTNYISFGIHKVLNEDIEVHIGNPLYKKRFVMVGDSICAGQIVGGMSKSWVEIIGSNNDMIVTNKGIGGSTLRTKEGKANIVDRIMALDTNNYDYIIVQGGVNDMAENLGSWIKPTTGGSSDYPSLASLDRSTTYGAMEYLCKYCMINFPTKKFGFIITYRGTDRTWNDVSENIKGICEKYGMPYIDLRSCGGFNLLDAEIRAVYGMSSDYKQTYNSELGYKLDEQAIYNGKLYKANESITAPAGSFDESKWTYIADVGGYDSWHCNYTAYLQSAPKIESWLKTL